MTAIWFQSENVCLTMNVYNARIIASLLGGFFVGILTCILIILVLVERIKKLKAQLARVCGEQSYQFECFEADPILEYTEDFKSKVGKKCGDIIGRGLINPRILFVDQSTVELVSNDVGINAEEQSISSEFN
ncbi:hypothetical protein K435DRAFT_862571 [Dendrothele bispora CBS 962.96]|uniref:Uncharacterized protein n=1 Tax=Dendrothele bispora (strain CBS 962.96) TaxID=1314807 RepID=A0A4S8LS73_DENBC|nr:hypothetical protein K435DRAFT_862571 [Dendrothele bispora CBS 962.96]